MVEWPVVRQAHHERLSERHCGLRAYFFGLAAVAVLYWRDSRSATLATLSGPVTGKELP